MRALAPTARKGKQIKALIPALTPRISITLRMPMRMNALVMFAVNACIGLEIVSRVDMKNLGYARMRTAAMRFVIITASNSALLMKIGT